MCRILLNRNKRYSTHNYWLPEFSITNSSIDQIFLTDQVKPKDCRVTEYKLGNS
jgi:hypothetical protein